MTFYSDDRVVVHHGDCLDVLATLPDHSVDSVVTDPPYGLEFMGKAWDAPWKGSAASHADARTRRAAEIDDPSKGKVIRAGVNAYEAGKPFQQWCQQWAAECLRVLKPGGHLLAFGGSRTWHRLACAVEDAGFEVRDSIAWLYGQGFPKSLDVSKAIDKASGAEREIIGPSPYQVHASSSRAVTQGATHGGSSGGYNYSDVRNITAPATPAAEQWKGWGTALKPAFEPIVVARKPLAGTVAANVLTHGTGALNIDACRTNSQSAGPGTTPRSSVGGRRGSMAGAMDRTEYDGSKGRWPANVVLDESQAEALDEMSGHQRDGTAVNRNRSEDESQTGVDVTYGGEGGASRFFYVAKAGADERPRVDGTAHPTVKPLDLMRWLVRLVTPPGGVILEPFAGSGTTVEACILEGFRCVAIEREAEYLPLIQQRINRRRDPIAYLRMSGDQLGLFDEQEPA